jgi:hypothetical protein
LTWFGVLSVETFECLSQVNPSYFEGVPLSDKKLVFKIPFNATRDVAKAQMKRLLESQLVEYSYEIFLFGFAAFAGG